ncbi:MAG: hypothetical protein FJY65_05290 [Calditrichaeota bacterium]|nr:hypothetical protein [Calditrichota bacterium]
MLNSKSPRGLVTTEEFLVLSAEINYQLSAREINRQALLALVLGMTEIEEKDVLLDTIACLQIGYGKQTRKIGPLAILHPLRTAAILARVMSKPTMLDLLGALLHDKEEDLVSQRIGETDYQRLEEEFAAMLRHIDHAHQWYLGERLDLLRRREDQSYTQYIGRILDNAHQMPDLLHIKLADRFDNTFDIHLQRPGVIRYNFFRTVFDILFVPDFPGVQVSEYHFLPGEDESIILISQIFKNANFMSLLRQEGLDRLDETTANLFDALAIANIREAQWIALELFASYIVNVKRQRELLIEVMDYCQSGGTFAVTSRERGHPLDGTFMERYGGLSDEARRNKIRELYRDKEQLARVTLAFIAIFSSFLNDPNFYLQGISRGGIRAVDDRWAEICAPR